MSTTRPQSTESAESAESAPQRILQRLIMPLAPTPDVIPLYIESQAV